MALACQRDSFLQQLTTRVLRCEPTAPVKGSGKKAVADANTRSFDVVTEDTVLFPEGGGQNSDHGTLNGWRVVHVRRAAGGEAVHVVEAEGVGEPPFSVGQEVNVVVDWTRRFDNMQQHSGQHLLSAVLENSFGLNTTSWWLAENDGDRVGLSYVELDSEDDAAVAAVVPAAEDACNEAIRKHLPVKVKVFQDVKDPELVKAHTRGLPEDVHGPVRVVEIGQTEEESVDSNMCCGTHVSNLAQLQALKIVKTEKGKKGRTNVYFVFGRRVLMLLGRAIDREARLTAALNGGPDCHVDLVQKAIKSQKSTQKSLQNVLKELAALKAQAVLDTKPKYILEKDGDNDYLNVFISEVTDKGVFTCVVVGDDKQGACQMAVVGKEEDVKALGQRIIGLLMGKGGGKGARLNAKVTSLKELDNVRVMLGDHFGKSKKQEE